MTKILDNLVRFAALMSLIGILTGFSSQRPSLQVIEVITLVIWLQMDYRSILKAIKQLSSIFKNTIK